jgi:copper chaperone CopZ/thiol-disulfide isomerase/thioredoxin
MIATFLLLTTLTFKVPSMDCAGCAKPVGRTLSAIAGVSNVHVDWKKKSATIDVPPDFDRERLRKAMLNAGYEVQFAGEKLQELQPVPPDVLKTLDIKAFDGSRAIDFQGVTEPGKITIVDFYADWCGPCKVVELRLQHFMQGKNIAVRRVNVGKWDNAAAKQATRDFRLASLPYLRVYDANGKFVSEVKDGMWDELLDTVEKASQ